MALEIERRFVVSGDGWRGLAPAVQYRQGYLSVEKERTVRVRVVGQQAWLTLKSNISNVSRHEFEYPIPLADAQTIMGAMCPMVVDKLRHRIEHGGFVWEVDEFFGDNAGLVLAEIELPDEDTPFAKPDWVGEEVTEDGRYTNAYLSKHPYRSW
ncbi:CYTH domain-containing protein [Chromobacterium violaceum]|uniref:Adenylate cyclase n=1 Tax=Chromobacterium violaceum TaxID=536 RepID=A0A1R0MN32_CHRVL|nr:CYTH domain-containing protein [Chromobacterium violaceum]ATP27039.1 CYTH domain-containing protein [Chromobacterium violaceum]ATP30952.1 CYTH domain-containing protein [Chromobacterium violaceum]KMN49585.1 adenylate cyclase [Chromobacterium violaceum]KMN84937.1 adenylate cyclase [Chromobacterium violaceum]KMN89322.1 adenylate cyclase [Chromobacterium violaceum]